MLTTKRLSIIDDLVKKLSNEDDKWMSLAIAIDLADELNVTKRTIQNYLQGKSKGYLNKGIKKIQYL